MFNTNNFIFNGISSMSKSVELVSFNADTINNIGIGFSRNVERMGTTHNTALYSSSDSQPELITLSLTHLDINGRNPLPWSVEKRMDIIEWMVSDIFLPFKIQDGNRELTYYLKCTGYTKNFTHDMKGSIDFEMQPMTPYAYIESVESSIVSSNKEVVVNNSSNLTSTYKPLIMLENITSESITIENKNSPKEPFTIINTKGKTITIDNQMGTVLTPSKESLISYCNRKWIELTKGDNTLSIVGSCKITIKSQFPIME